MDLVVTLGVSLTSCAQIGTTTPESVRVPAQAERPIREGGLVDPSLQKFVEIAIDDLARRLGVERPAIDVIEVRPVVWPDRSLGCPRPGMNYPHVQQDGLLIRLGARGREYSYHSGGARAPFLCENQR